MDRPMSNPCIHTDKPMSNPFTKGSTSKNCKKTPSKTCKKTPLKPVNSNIYQAKKTFRMFKESISSSDYTIQRKAEAQGLHYGFCGNLVNPYDLYVNLISKLDLSDVCVIQNNDAPFNCPTTIDPNAVPFLDYEIDPSGTLFGNTMCGVNNFVKLMVYNPPSCKK
jgi:hypothetical protein